MKLNLKDKIIKFSSLQSEKLNKIFKIIFIVIWLARFPVVLLDYQLPFLWEAVTPNGHGNIFAFTVCVVVYTVLLFVDKIILLLNMNKNKKNK